MPLNWNEKFNIQELKQDNYSVIKFLDKHNKKIITTSMVCFIGKPLMTRLPTNEVLAYKANVISNPKNIVNNFNAAFMFGMSNISIVLIAGGLIFFGSLCAMEKLAKNHDFQKKFGKKLSIITLGAGIAVIVILSIL